MYICTHRIFCHSKLYVYVYMCMYTYTHIHTCIYVSIHIYGENDIYSPYICVCIYTHTHSFLPLRIIFLRPNCVAVFSCNSFIFSAVSESICNHLQQLFTDSTVDECVAFDKVIFCDLFHTQDIFSFSFPQILSY